jgi:toxin-antitoxin system PIN domain toxin
MVLCDVNVLVYAFRKDVPDHSRYHEWLETTVGGPEAFALSELVLSGFLRVVTHPGAFFYPTTLDQAFSFLSVLRERPNCVLVSPGERHWGIFLELCLKAGARGNLVPDAYHAALAIESGCEWITTDRDYARFPGLRWRHPLG